MDKIFLGVLILSLLLFSTTFGDEPISLNSGQARAVLDTEPTNVTKPASFRALLIGINGYTGTLSPLKYCVQDMKLLAKTLETIGLSHENTIIMTDDSEEESHKPTYTNILTQLDILTNDAEPEDTIIIAFSGHGVHDRANGKNFLYPKDANPRLVRTLISYADIEEMFSRSQAKRKLFLIDACRNTLLRGAKAGPNEHEGFNDGFEATKGTAFMLSCSQSEHSWELDKLNHGVFTFFLSKGLEGAADKNGDDLISLQELNEYVKEETKKLVWEENRAPQTPVLRTEISDDSSKFILARLGSHGRAHVKTKTKWQGQPVFGRLGGHLGKITGVAFSPDDRHLVSGGVDGMVRFWNVELGEEVHLVSTKHGEISSIAISPNGKFLLVGHHDTRQKYARSGQYMSLFDIEKWTPCPKTKLIREFPKDNAIQAVAFSQDGKQLLACDDAEDLGLGQWELETGAQLHSRSLHQLFRDKENKGYNRLLTSDIQFLQFYDPGNTLVVGNSHAVFRWNAEVNVPLDTIPFEFSVSCSSMASKTGDIVALWEGREMLLKNLDPTVPRRHFLFRHHVDASNDIIDDKVAIVHGKIDDKNRSLHLGVNASAISLSPNGELLAIATKRGVINLFSVTKLKALAPGNSVLAKQRFGRCYENRYGNRLAVSPDGKCLAAIDNEGILRQWSIESGTKLVNDLRIGNGGMGAEFQVVFSCDANKIAYVGFGPNVPFLPEREKAERWESENSDRIKQFGIVASIRNCKTGEEITLEGHTNRINAVAFSPDGLYVLTGCMDRTARIWNTETGNEVAVFESDSGIGSLAWHPNSKQFVTGHADGTIKFWDIEKSTVVWSEKNNEMLEWNRMPWDLCVSPNGRWLISRDRFGSKLWDVEQGKILRSLDKACCFSPDGKYYISTNTQGQVFLRSLADDSPIAEFGLYSSKDGFVSKTSIIDVLFTPDGQNIATSHQGGSIILWE